MLTLASKILAGSRQDPTLSRKNLEYLITSWQGLTKNLKDLASCNLQNL